MNGLARPDVGFVVAVRRSRQASSEGNNGFVDLRGPRGSVFQEGVTGSRSGRQARPALHRNQATRALAWRQARLPALAYLCRLRPMKVTHSLVLVVMTILQMSREGDGRIWGYALSKKSGVRSGVLYPQLDRMMDEGWLVDHWEEQVPDRKRPPRRYYTLTDEGRRNFGAIAHQARNEQRFAGLSAVNTNWGLV